MEKYFGIFLDPLEAATKQWVEEQNEWKLIDSKECSVVSLYSGQTNLLSGDANKVIIPYEIAKNMTRFAIGMTIHSCDAVTAGSGTFYVYPGFGSSRSDEFIRFGFSYASFDSIKGKSELSLFQDMAIAIFNNYAFESSTSFQSTLYISNAIGSKYSYINYVGQDLTNATFTLNPYYYVATNWSFTNFKFTFNFYYK